MYKELSQKKNDKYIFFKIKSSFIPWRFNIFFKENQYRNFVIKELLKKKLDPTIKDPAESPNFLIKERRL